MFTNRSKKEAVFKNYIYIYTNSASNLICTMQNNYNGKLRLHINNYKKSIIQVPVHCYYIIEYYKNASLQNLRLKICNGYLKTNVESVLCTLCRVLYRYFSSENHQLLCWATVRICLWWIGRSQWIYRHSWRCTSQSGSWDDFQESPCRLPSTCRSSCAPEGT